MRKAWVWYRLVMFLAAASLALYVPYKYLTQLHALEGIYAFLFPFSAVLALSGMLLAAKPERAFQLPLVVRGALGVIAAGWIATGVLCVPSLSKSVLSAPIPGLFAFFHMTMQHIVLSLLVGSLSILPHATFAWFGLPRPMRRRDASLAPRGA